MRVAVLLVGAVLVTSPIAAQEGGQTANKSPITNKDLARVTSWAKRLQGQNSLFKNLTIVVGDQNSKFNGMSILVGSGHEACIIKDDKVCCGSRDCETNK